MTDHDYLVLSTALILMVTNLLGAGFTIIRIQKRRAEMVKESNSSWVDSGKKGSYAE